MACLAVDGTFSTVVTVEKYYEMLLAMTYLQILGLAAQYSMWDCMPILLARSSNYVLCCCIASEYVYVSVLCRSESFGS